MAQWLMSMSALHPFACTQILVEICDGCVNCSCNIDHKLAKANDLLQNVTDAIFKKTLLQLEG